MTMTEDHNEELLTEQDLLKRWKISRHTLYKWRDEGNAPPFVLIGDRRRYRPDDIRKYEEKMLQSPGTTE